MPETATFRIAWIFASPSPAETFRAPSTNATRSEASARTATLVLMFTSAAHCGAVECPAHDRFGRRSKGRPLPEPRGVRVRGNPDPRGARPRGGAGDRARARGDRARLVDRRRVRRRAGDLAARGQAHRGGREG